MICFRPNLIFFPISSSHHSTKTLILSLTPPTNSDHYGPSLRRNQSNQSSDQSSDLDRPSFARAFIIPALRIPSSAASSLEQRLRGHLLNWPRIRNVARVPGDDLPPHFQTLLGSPERNDDRAEVMSPVLYREKLVKEFNCRGFLRFRNLARMSRPKKRRKGAEGGGGDREGEKVYVVREVSEGREGEEDEMRGLIGEEGFDGRWRGPTRLLLLDERFKDKEFEELPGAVKV